MKCFTLKIIKFLQIFDAVSLLNSFSQLNQNTTNTFNSISTAAHNNYLTEMQRKKSCAFTVHSGATLELLLRARKTKIWYLQDKCCIPYQTNKQKKKNFLVICDKFSTEPFLLIFFIVKGVYL